MHSVLHRWCFHVFKGEKADMSWLAAMVIASAVPSARISHYTLIQRRLLPHCDSVYWLLQKWVLETLSSRVNISAYSGACHNIEFLYWNQGKMKKAEEIYLRALIEKEKA